MGYKSLQACVQDLERQGQLIRIQQEMDPMLEMAEVQRRVYLAQGPAILFENVKGSAFPAVSNLFGTFDRSKYIFRDTLSKLQKLMEVKADPGKLAKNPFRYAELATVGLNALPRKKRFSPPVLGGRCKVEELPLIQSWPEDGGAYVLLPQVYTEDPDAPGLMKSNLGMYRVQLSGNEYELNKEIGLHYQIHRGIGVHHAKALARGEKLKVTIFVGGPPSHTFSAVMPLPEGLSESMFAGMLGGRPFRYTHDNGHTLSADADFCITGTIGGETKPEGPFGDHLGYYSLKHDFPLMKVDQVYHRKDAIWPFTTVGRPPQEDTSFGQLIHEIVGPVVSSEIPGVQAMHAVDAAGVHPLLYAVGSERYVPYGERYPMEILTQANAILGFGQASLAKYLMIAAKEDVPTLDIHDERAFFLHVLERARWECDLHFQTRTTMDTLDYSGTGLNEGSKVVIAAAGPKRFDLADEIPADFQLPYGYNDARMAMPGVIAVTAPAFKDQVVSGQQVELFASFMKERRVPQGVRLLVLVDDAAFTAKTLNNFLWSTFTRSNPSHDVYGVDSFTEHKHWGCHGPLIIDARIKPHHAPPLIEDPGVTARVDKLGVKGQPLHGII